MKVLVALIFIFCQDSRYKKLEEKTKKEMNNQNKIKTQRAFKQNRTNPYIQTES